jgi:hypothetical protein
MESDNNYIKKTKIWIDRLVVGLNLCPFAKYSFQDGNIHYEISDSDDFTPMMQELVELVQMLSATASESMKDDDSSGISNAFIIYTQDVSFDFMLDLEYSFVGLLEDAGLDTKFQTVVFHPQFKYEGEDNNAHGNFTNRSPYPMIHILRAEEVSEAIAKTINVDMIPTNNTAKLEKLAITRVSEVFEDNFEDRVLEVLNT